MMQYVVFKRVNRLVAAFLAMLTGSCKNKGKRDDSAQFSRVITRDGLKKVKIKYFCFLSSCFG